MYGDFFYPIVPICADMKKYSSSHTYKQPKIQDLIWGIEKGSKYVCGLWVTCKA